VYYVCLGTLFAFDAQTSAPLWNVSSPDGMPVIGANGVVYVSGFRFYAGKGPASNFAAFDGQSGKMLWASPLLAVDNLSPCALDKTEKICVLGTLKDSKLYGLSTADGSIVWSQDFYFKPSGPFWTIAPVTSYATIIGRVAYIPNALFSFVAVDVFTGKALYYGTVPGIDRFSGRSLFIAASSALSIYRDNTIVAGMQEAVRNYNEVRFYDLANVSNMSMQLTGYAVSSQPLITADSFALVTFCSLEGGWGGILAYDLTNGRRQQVWSTSALEPELCSLGPVAVDSRGIIYVVDKFGRFYSFKVLKGTIDIARRHLDSVERNE